MEKLKIWADGGCDGNPGPMQYLIYIESEPPKTYKKRIGNGTNNQAELHAMIKALEQIPVYATLGYKLFEICIDSEYVYYQILGMKKTRRNKALVNETKLLYTALKKEHRIAIHHVLREKNKAGVLLEKWKKKPYQRKCVNCGERFDWWYTIDPSEVNWALCKPCYDKEVQKIHERKEKT